MGAEDIFTIETFVGLHIFLAAANLLYSILDRFIRVIEEHLLSPVIDLLLGDCIDYLKWELPTTKPDTHNTIDMGQIIKEIIRLAIITLFSFYVYKYFKYYKKYSKLKH